MFLVDTNILLDIFHDDPAWRPWSEPCLRDALLEGEVGINPIIYAETSLGFRAPETLDAELDAIAVTRLGLPYEAAFLAGRAFRRYRRAGGVRPATVLAGLQSSVPMTAGPWISCRTACATGARFEF